MKNFDSGAKETGDVLPKNTSFLNWMKTGATPGLAEPTKGAEKFCLEFVRR